MKTAAETPHLLELPIIKSRYPFLSSILFTVSVILILATFTLCSGKYGTSHTLAARIGVPPEDVNLLWIGLPIALLGCVMAYIFQTKFHVKGKILFSLPDRIITITQNDTPQLLSFQDIETIKSNIRFCKGEIDGNSALISSGTKNYLDIKRKNHNQISIELLLLTKSDKEQLQSIINQLREASPSLR